MVTPLGWPRHTHPRQGHGFRLHQPCVLCPVHGARLPTHAHPSNPGPRRLTPSLHTTQQVPGPELPSNLELTPTATPAPHSVTSFSVPSTTRCLSPASTSSPRQAGQLCSSSLHAYGGLGTKPGEEGSAGQCARQRSRTGRQRSPERAGDSARVTQQEAAEPRQPGVSSSHCMKPNHPRSCLSSFLPEPQDPKCLGDGQRAGEGQEAGREGVG